MFKLNMLENYIKRILVTQSVNVIELIRIPKFRTCLGSIK